MGPLSLFSELGSYVAIRLDKPIIDNGVFRAHYKWTTMLFFLCTILVSARSYFGEPMSCHSDDKSYEHIMTVYCWVSATFTLPPNKLSPYPGVSSYTDERNREKYHQYYQWVPFVLFLQGLMFQIPHWVWKHCEEGRIGVITEGIRGVVVDHMSDEKISARNKLVSYLVDNLNEHNAYASRYFFCEVLNFINIVLNIFLTDMFLGGEFLTYGFKVLQFSMMDQENRIDPMVTIFPKLTKCTFENYGASGTIQRHDALCVLALNHLNEKIYIVLWFWLLILAVPSCLTLLYSMALYTLPKFRELILVHRFKLGTNKAVSKLIRRLKVGDFLMMHFLGQNLDFIYFNDVMVDVCHHLHIEDPSNQLPLMEESTESETSNQISKVRNQLVNSEEQV